MHHGIYDIPPFVRGKAERKPNTGQTRKQLGRGRVVKVSEPFSSLASSPFIFSFDPLLSEKKNLLLCDISRVNISQRKQNKKIERQQLWISHYVHFLQRIEFFYSHRTKRSVCNIKLRFSPKCYHTFFFIYSEVTSLNSMRKWGAYTCEKTKF